MDSVYKPDLVFSTDLFSPTEYFTEFKTIIDKTNADLNDKEATEKEIFHLMRLDLDESKKQHLTETCSVDKLTVDNEVELMCIKELLNNQKTYTVPPVTEEAKTLCTIEKLMNRKVTSSKNDLYLCNLKYRSENFIFDYSSSGESDLSFLNPETVFIIRVYFPFRYCQGLKTDRKPRYNFTLALLGTNTLADLRDKLVCPMDMCIAKDISDNQDIGEPFSGVMAKDIYKSGLIYINGVLYEDLRFSSSTNYSDTIIQWSQTVQNVGPFEVKNMAEVQLRDLKIRFGYPYVYQHQGECEHLFTFSDVRLWNASDSSCSSDYPLYKARCSKISKTCMMCGNTVARVLIKHCDRLPSDPAYLCDICYKSYLFNDGKKVADFKAFLYYDDSCIF